MNTIGIYIHVPFCGKKCGYCDFYSVRFDKRLTELYVEAVIRNLKHYSDRNIVTDTLYFGGGTPSLLSLEQIESIILAVKDNFFLDCNAEITLETNPNTLTPEKLQKLRNAGVNRLSIGVQSMLNSELQFLGRTHTAERAEKAVSDAVAAGFENISCDLMIALPNQNTASLEYSIEKITSLPIQHISAYMLKIEKNTPFDKSGVINQLPNDDFSGELYLKTVEQLEKAGFMQYEVSNFAKKGYESRHNCRYWKCMDYIGIGSSAHSCLNGKRFSVGRDVQNFIDSPVQQTEITDDNPCGFEEYAMLRLRLKEGLDLKNIGANKSKIEKKIPSLVQAGYAEFNNGIVSLTPKGFLVSNSVIEYLVF